jgi:hypothetical protein
MYHFLLQFTFWAFSENEMNASHKKTVMGFKFLIFFNNITVHANIMIRNCLNLRYMQEKLKAFERLLNIMDDLREKCPWDKKQTIESLRHLTIEETYELSDAILKTRLQ